MHIWIKTDNDNRVCFVSSIETLDCMKIIRPNDFDTLHMWDWKLEENQLVYDPVPAPEPEPEPEPTPLDVLRADVDYLLMITEEM